MIFIDPNSIEIPEGGMAKRIMNKILYGNPEGIIQSNRTRGEKIAALADEINLSPSDEVFRAMKEEPLDFSSASDMPF
jgi:hypothetical protein